MPKPPSMPLDAFGQSARLYGLYTQLCYCFSVQDTSLRNQAAVAGHLSIGLQRLSNSVPWISGQVVQNEREVFEIREFSGLPLLVIKDLSDSLPSFEVFQRARFPFSMLDERVIASRKTLPDKSEGPKPVFEIQCNFIESGILLVFSAQHNCMDMRGQAQMIHLLAKACVGESLTPEEVGIANASRADIIRIAEDLKSSTGPNADLFGKNPNHNGVRASQDSNAVQSNWTYFAFPRLALRELKARATEAKTVEFVSTDDVLSALIWQSVTRARSDRLSANDRTSFDRQVDARKFLDIAPEYPGTIVHKISIQNSVGNVLDTPLGVLASKLRQPLQDRLQIAEQALTVAQGVVKENASGKTSAGNTRVALPSADIKMSSWAKERCCEDDFGGILGKPVAVRRPRFEAWEGLAYLLPKSQDGEIVVALCLRERDMEKLREDGAFMSYAEYIG